MATQEEVAAHIDLSSRQVRTLLKSGVLPSGSGAGGLNIDACRMAYIRYLRGKATGRVEQETGDLNGEEERARLTHHQANLAEIDEKTKRGELVFEDQVVGDIREGMTNFRAKILSLPPKVASLLAGIDDAHEIQAVLEGVCHEALTELSNPYVSMDESGPSS